MHVIHDSFTKRVDAYANTTEHNDRLHTEFSQLVQDIPFLAQHRKHVEINNLGFGDSAFHYMWYLLVQQLAEKFPEPKLLEIGVFKGQVISLWALIAAKLNLELSITGISPLKGHAQPSSKWLNKWKFLTNAKFRQDLRSGNFYPEEDYLSTIKGLFETFDLQFAKIQIIEGYSHDANVIELVDNKKYSLIYIDGDHSFEGVKRDIETYAAKVEEGGFLVMDDASSYLPGNTFWKGHESVSRACEIIPALGFVNVLNVGHNRVYQKLK